MKRVTTRGMHVPRTGAGLPVVPTAAVLPVQIHASADQPTALLVAVDERADALRAVLGSASLTLDGYRTWTEKLGGKGLFGRGVRHRSTATGTIRLPLDPDDGYRERVTALEGLRERLAPLEDDELRVGEAAYVLDDPEVHRAALLARIRSRVDAVAEAFGLAIVGLELGTDIEVSVTGPAAAEVHLSATARLGPLA